MISRNSINGAYPIRRLGEVVEFLDSKRRPVTESDRRAGPYPYYGANGIQGTIDEFIFDEPLVLLAEDGGHFGEPDRGIAYRISGKTWVDHATIRKLRENQPLTVDDLAELEQMLIAAGVGRLEDLRRACEEADGLGLFVRSLVGLDRAAAKTALGEFIAGRALSANQLEFINLVVDHLTEYGQMPAERLYESPFTDVSPQGPDGLFASDQVDRLLTILSGIRLSAIVA